LACGKGVLGAAGLEVVGGCALHVSDDAAAGTGGWGTRWLLGADESVQDLDTYGDGTVTMVDEAIGTGVDEVGLSEDEGWIRMLASSISFYFHLAHTLALGLGLGVGVGVGRGVGVGVGVGVGRLLLVGGRTVVVTFLVEVTVVVPPRVMVSVAVPDFKMLLQKSRASEVWPSNASSPQSLTSRRVSQFQP
jgi:hypothetical protein